MNTSTPSHHRVSRRTAVSVSVAGLGADEHSEVEIGSVTKTFTAEILRNQIRASRVAADTAVGEIIDVHDAPVGDVTLGELATHTSELPRLAGNNPVRVVIAGFLGTNPYAGITRGDVIDAARSAELSGRGEEEYSNFGFGSSASCWPSRPAPPTRHWSPSRFWSRWG